MLDDLRNFSDDEDDDDDEIFGEEEFGRDVNEGGPLFLGMTAIERMFLSMFLFMNVAILGIAVLLATNRI
jgi:hypothetical protein